MASTDPVNVTFGDRLIRWTCAVSLVRELNGCTILPLDDVTSGGAI